MKNSTIYITGFMGSGKSSVGRMLSHRLNRQFIDTDTEIERQTGKTTSDTFAAIGENGFRELETSILHHVSRSTDTIIALGGGGVIREINRDIMQETGFSIFLHFPPAVIAARLRHDVTRPLLHNLTQTEKLKKITVMLNERMIYYKTADLTLHLTTESVDEICTIIIKAIGSAT